MRVILTGAECSGKTTLANQVAEVTQSSLLPEQARIYLDQKGLDYNPVDLLHILVKHDEEEMKLSESNDNYICDTDALTLYLWYLIKYGEHQPLIYDYWREHNDGLYIVCAPVEPWEADPQREHPEGRDLIHLNYIEMLTHHRCNFEVIDGTSEERLSRVIQLMGFNG